MPDDKIEDKEVKDIKQKGGDQQKEAEPEPQETREKEMKEQLLRLAAEFDNYKKRVKVDLDGARGMGKAELMKSLLPIIDEFDLALIAVNKAEDKNIARGVEMLYSNFTDVLKKEGLNEIPCKGVFDPYMHEIIITRESKEKDGTILEVVKKGYTLEKTLLRPASVIIAKKQESESAMPDVR
jgi:molecular chaperone GrpE